MILVELVPADEERPIAREVLGSLEARRRDHEEDGEFG
jgi:hypothetical protein